MSLRGDRGCRRLEQTLAVGPEHCPELIRGHAGLASDEVWIDDVDQSDLRADGCRKATGDLHRVRGELTSVDGDEEVCDVEICNQGGRIT